GGPLRRAQRLASEPGGARGGMALVEPATMGARGSRISHAFPMAAATARRLAGNRELPAERSGVGGPAPLRPAWLAVWEYRLDGNDRKAIKNRVVPTRSRKTQERTVESPHITCVSELPRYPGFGGCDLFLPFNSLPQGGGQQ